MGYGCISLGLGQFKASHGLSPSVELRRELRTKDEDGESHLDECDI
jgi:hypothetical protein